MNGVNVGPSFSRRSPLHNTSELRAPPLSLKCWPIASVCPQRHNAAVRCGAPCRRSSRFTERIVFQFEQNRCDGEDYSHSYRRAPTDECAVYSTYSKLDIYAICDFFPHLSIIFFLFRGCFFPTMSEGRSLNKKKIESEKNHQLNL